MYLCVRLENRRILTKKNENRTHQRVTTRILQGRDEARLAKSRSRGRPHLDLGRLRLKTWFDFSIAGTS